VRYLITGGAGFIGSHLADALLRTGDEVTIVDDLSTGAMANIEHLKSREGFRCVVGSVTDEVCMAGLIDSSDVIFHLAAAVGVKLVVESPIRTAETNINGTETVLRLASTEKKKVILTSTSEVYGKSEKVPFSEDDDLVLGPTRNSRWIYACSKALDEFLCLAYWQEHGLPVVIVRLFNIVGPRQTGKYGMVLPTFIKQALSGNPITVYGDGRQSRCFTWVGDAVDTMIRLSRESEAVGGVFNVGSTEEITMAGLAALVKEVTGSRSDIVYVPYESAYKEGFEDLRRRVPDTSKVTRLTGHKLTRDLRQIIKDIAEDLNNGPLG